MFDKFFKDNGYAIRKTCKTCKYCKKTTIGYLRYSVSYVCEKAIGHKIEEKAVEDNLNLYNNYTVYPDAACKLYETKLSITGNAIKLFEKEDAICGN